MRRSDRVWIVQAAPDGAQRIFLPLLVELIDIVDTCQPRTMTCGISIQKTFLAGGGRQTVFRLFKSVIPTGHYIFVCSISIIEICYLFVGFLNSATPLNVPLYFLFRT